MSGAVLGVDLGGVRIGVAISEAVDLPAMPLCTVAHKSRALDVRNIVALAEERGAATIVVGYPLRLNGTRGAATAVVDKFVAELRTAFAGTVETADERLTTGAAAARLRATGLSGGKRRGLVDRLAAVEILDTWLARRRRAP